MWPSRSGLLASFGFLFLYVPIAVVILYAFNDSRLVAVWTHPSLRWFHSVFQDEVIRSAVSLSLRIAFGAATLATLLGALAAITVQSRSHSLPGRVLLGGLVGGLVVPDVVLGFSYLMMFVVLGSAIGAIASWGAMTILIAHVTLALPYCFMIVRSRLTPQEVAVQEAAADLGAAPATVFARITVPLLAPSLVGAWLAAFVVSFDDVVVASFVARPGSSTLPMVIFSSVRLGVSPAANALAAMMFAVAAAAFALAVLLLLRRKSKLLPANGGFARAASVGLRHP